MLDRIASPFGWPGRDLSTLTPSSGGVRRWRREGSSSSTRWQLGAQSVAGIAFIESRCTVDQDNTRLGHGAATALITALSDGTARARWGKPVRDRPASEATHRLLLQTPVHGRQREHPGREKVGFTRPCQSWKRDSSLQALYRKF